MNRAETLKILSVIKAAYQSFGGSDTTAIINLWQRMLEDEPYELVNAAVMGFISSDTKGFAPVIGQIKAMCIKLMDDESLSEAEAVSLILKAAKNGLYGAREEFDKLPSICQRIVVSPERLADWAKLDEDEVNTVIASNLRRAYVSQAKKDEEIKALPNESKAMLGNLKMIGGTE